MGVLKAAGGRRAVALACDEKRDLEHRGIEATVSVGDRVAEGLVSVGLHSEQDLRCPIEQAEQLFVLLRRLGREVEMVRFPEESHNLSRSGRPDRRVERLQRITGWFDTHM